MAWIRMFICFGMAIMLISLVLLGQLPLLLHPRFHSWTYFSIVMFILFGWVQALNLKHKELHRVGFWGYGLVILPILVYIFIPPKSLDASIAQKKGALYAKASQQQQKTETTTPKVTKPSPEDNQEDPNVKNLQAMLQQQEPIELTDANFANNISAMETYAEKMKGKRVRLTGMVYREQGELQKNQLVIGRFMVSCCTADANVIGLVAQSDEYRDLKDNKWYTVTGKLSTIKMFDFASPLLQIERFEPAKEPKDPYVYFSY